MRVALVGKNPTDTAFCEVSFDVVIPRERLVVRELVEAGRKSTEEGAAAVAYLRLCSAALVLCCPDLARAVQEAGHTFARSGYSALTFGGHAYLWLTEARSIGEDDIVTAGAAILRECLTAAQDWERQQEALAAARKACRPPPGPGTAASTP